MSRDPLAITVDVVCSHNPDLVERFQQGDQEPLVEEVMAVAARNVDHDDVVDAIVNEVGSAEDHDPDDEMRKMAGLPVVRDDGARLAFLNPKSGSDTIHIARVEQPPEQTTFLGSLGSTYTWSVCGGGAARGKTKDNAIYLDAEEQGDEYIERDGEIVGKLCGNCKRSLDPADNPFS